MLKDFILLHWVNFIFRTTVRTLADFNAYCLLWVLTTVTHEDEPIWRDSSNYKLLQVKVLTFLSMGMLFHLLNGLLLAMLDVA